MNQAPATRHWSLSIDVDALASLHLDVDGSSTNVLSAEVLGEFEQLLEYIETQTVNGLMIVSDKSSGFIAGADIKEFTRIQNEQEALQLIQRGQTLFDRLEALSIPTISVINGFCVGGGLELALACDYRIALDQPKTRIGLPEVKLGIHPGFGGSMRLNRLIGAVSAMSLMLTGRTVDARQAKRLGIIDYAVPDRQLSSAASAMLKTSPKPRRASFLKALQSNTLLRPMLSWLFRRQVAKQASPNQYPAPYALIDVWQLYAGSERAMLDAEARSAAKLIITDTSKNLVRVFMLQERLKSLGKQRDSSLNAVNHVHVVGAGTMGGDIASWSALRNLSVTLQDREAKFIAPSIKRASKLFNRKFKPARLAHAAMDRLHPDLQGIGIKQADVIIEAIVENAEIKQDLFKSLESQCKPDAILATNTSSIPLETLNQVLQQPERLVGIHFFNPVARMQLVEIVSAANTSPQVVSAAAAFVRQIDRLPLPVKSAPGFLINRILMPYLLEAVELLSEGVPAEVIDQTATDFGMPMGPIRLADTVGLDICLSVANILADQLNMQVPVILKQKVDDNHLGKKSGQGFYDYQPSRFKLKQTQKSMEHPPEDVEDRLILRMLNECIACLREEVIEDADLLDAGMVFATGFAPFTGGPMHYLHNRGRDSVMQRLTELESRYGERFHPDPGWTQRLV
ncbi:MAG: enoyl-CoA hydratase/isomerase family protein [Gammaproteobacteria bacterium]|nr:enoyl-CoA hydratase/isomerase family protein [Gammaproteobacteria bacterium]